MRVIRLSENVSLAFGLTWEGHDPIDRSLHEQIRRWREKGYTLACRYSRLGGHIYGLSSGDGFAKDKTRVFGAAGLIATHKKLADKTALVTIEITLGDHPLAIVVGLKNGIVILDQIAELEEVTELTNRYVGLLPSSTPYEKWGEVSSLPAVDHAFGLEEIQTTRQLEVKPLRSTKTMLYAGMGAGVLALVGVSMFAWGVFQERQKAELAMKEAMMRKSPEALYQESIAQLLATPIVRLGDAMTTVHAQFKDFPVMFAGWSLESIECMGTTCNVTWLRTAGTFQEFKNAAPKEWENVFSASQEKITHTVAIKFPENKLPAQKDWPRVQDFREKTYALWQLLKPNWVAALENPVKQALPPGLTPDQAKQLKNYPGAPLGMVLDVQNQVWWLVNPEDPRSPMQAQNLGDTVALTGPVQLKFDGKEIKFSAKGIVYVQ